MADPSSQLPVPSYSAAGMNPVGQRSGDKRTPTPDQRGLEVKAAGRPIFLLPVRYAVGWHESRTPSISNAGPFKVVDMDAGGKDSGETVAAASGLHYTLRRLREGYLHVYAGKSLGWRIYRVSDGFGSLSFLADYKAPKYKRRPCDEGAIDPIQPTEFWDRCLLRVPEKTTLWFAFSDVRWTEFTMDKAADNKESFRDKHMREIKTTGWSGAHVTNLGEMGKWVADFASGMSPKACWFSQERFERISFESYRKTLIERGFLIENDLSLGALLALDDSAGMVMDLATSMEARYEQWCGKPDPSCSSRTNEWMMASAKGIELLKNANDSRVENIVYDDFRTNCYS